jgi:hypothetical protein
MPNAQCPMPNAQCPMPNAQCPMPSGFAFDNQSGRMGRRDLQGARIGKLRLIGPFQRA